MRKINAKFLLRKTEFSLFIITLMVFLVLTFFSKSFLTSYNSFTILRTISLYIVIGLAQAFPIAIGNMNLSVGAIGGLATITTGFFLQNLGTCGWVAVIAALTVGLIAGAVNGVLIAKVGMNSFVVTLATMFVYKGVVLGLTKGFSFTDIPRSFTFMGTEGFFNIPLLFYFIVFILIICYLFFNHITLGRRTLATGGDIEAARLAGVNTKMVVFSIHCVSGFIAALTGILYVSMIGSAQPAIGTQWLIRSFAVAIIGGTALKGGYISPLGILLGATLLVLINNGLILLKASIYFQETFFGLIILLAIIIDRIRETRKI